VCHPSRMRLFHHGAAFWTLGTLALAACGPAPAPKAPPSEDLAAQDMGEMQPAAAPVAPAPEPPKLRLPCAEDDLVGCTNGCNDEVVEDCVTLGAMYMRGNVVRTDPTRAIDLFRGACTNGSARGCMKLGDLYHDGTLKDDPTEEVTLYRKACDAGANRGCLAAGKAYLEGRIVGVDPVFAATLFTRICERGNAEACLELGRLYNRGHGVRKDPTRATTLFTKACQLGLDEGCLTADPTGEVAPPRQ